MKECPMRVHTIERNRIPNMQVIQDWGSLGSWTNRLKFFLAENANRILLDIDLKLMDREFSWGERILQRSLFTGPLFSFSHEESALRMQSEARLAYAKATADWIPCGGWLEAIETVHHSPIKWMIERVFRWFFEEKKLSEPFWHMMATAATCME